MAPFFSKDDTTLSLSHLLLERCNKAFGDFKAGLDFGYPVCCVLNYCLDSLFDIPSGISRGQLRNSVKGTYVPCRAHMKVLSSMSKSECLKLADWGLDHLAPNDVIEVFVNGSAIFSVRIPEGLDGVMQYRMTLLNPNQER